jgi:hypothetical protein
MVTPHRLDFFLQHINRRYVSGVDGFSAVRHGITIRALLIEDRCDAYRCNVSFKIERPAENSTQGKFPVTKSDFECPRESLLSGGETNPRRTAQTETCILTRQDDNDDDGEDGTDSDWLITCAEAEVVAPGNTWNRAVKIRNCALIRQDSDQNDDGDDEEPENNLRYSCPGHQTREVDNTLISRAEPIPNILSQRVFPHKALLARWAEWYNPPVCDKKKLSSDQEECRRHHKAVLIAYVALAVGGTCGLLLAMIHCITCIRRKRFISHDLKKIMSNQVNSLEPIARGPPIKIQVDGHSSNEKASSEMTSPRGLATVAGRLSFIDEEASIESTTLDQSKSLDGSAHHWASWLFPRTSNKAVSNTVRTTFAYP